MAAVEPVLVEQVTPLPRIRRRTLRRTGETAFWYAVLVFMAIITVFPFAWILLTSLKGPADAIFSTPPQFIPGDPTLDNYQHVLDALPVPTFFLNSIVATTAVTVLNVIVASLAAYPLAKMRFRGRDAIFYLLLALALLAFCLMWAVESSRFGHGLRAIRENEEAAQSIGIPVARFKLLAFMLSAIVPAMVGGVMATRSTYFEATQVFDPMVSVTIIAMALINGSGPPA